MIEVDIRSNNSNQYVDFEYGNVSYKIHLYSFRGTTLADVEINQEPVVYGVRCVPNSNLIPQKYLTKGGNFRFVCVDGDYPYFTKFNQTQQLVFYTDEELDKM